MSQWYRGQLRDPRWQRRRLEIMQRADFSCEECSSKTRTLHVHHKIYRTGAMPWEYTDAELACICEDCHSAEHEIAIVPLAPLKRRTDFQSDTTYLAHVQEYLLRKAECMGLDALEKAVLSDLLAGRYGRAA